MIRILTMALIALFAGVGTLMYGCGEQTEKETVKKEQKTTPLSADEQLKKDVQAAIMKRIDEKTMVDKFLMYDPQNGAVKKLTYISIHEGVGNKGNFYVSCVDFEDSKGGIYDIDMLVRDVNGNLTAVHSVIHKVNDVEREYYVEGDKVSLVPFKKEEAVDKAMEKTEEMAGEAAEKTDEAADEAAEKVEDAVGDAVEKTDEMTEHK